jgi:hypothetical protein
MGDGISVDLNALTTFAHSIGKTADGAQPEMKGLSQDVANNSMDVLRGSMHSMVASHNDLGYHDQADFQESSAFARYHGVVSLSAVQFITDVFKGAVSLGAGAEFCAVNYANTDAFNARTMQGVTANVKAGGFTGQNFPLSGHANISGDNVNGAFAPKDGDGVFVGSGGKAPVDPNKVGTPTDPKTGQAVNPDDQFQKNLDQQRKDVAAGKVPDLPPGRTPAPDTTDMPVPDETPAKYQPGGGTGGMV